MDEFIKTLHIDWKSGTAFCIRQLPIIIFKFPKGSKRFSSSVARDAEIAFRLTETLFFFRNKWVIILNGTTKLGLFSNIISASLLGTTDL